MAGACFLGVEVDAERIKRQLRSGYLDFMVNSLDEALRILKNAIRKKENISVGLIGNCADVIPELADRGVLPDILTDQTSAHDPLNGYVPNGMPLAAALELRQSDPKTYEERSLAAIVRHAKGMLSLQMMGAVTFDYGSNIRTFALQQGVKNANDIPGFVAAYLRPLCSQGRGPLRWVALSGDASDIAVIDDLVLQLFPHDRVLKRWIDVARTRIRFQGLPARICWLGYGERAQLGLAINELVKQGRVKAPIVIAGDDLDCGSAGSASGEPEGMKDGDDAAANWPMLNALLNTASGASWVSIYNSGEAGIGYSQRAGWVTVADGTDEMARRIEHVLTNDAGDVARDSARQAGAKIPIEKM
jgi:urocanate hydratase